MLLVPIPLIVIYSPFEQPRPDPLCKRKISHGTLSLALPKASAPNCSRTSKPVRNSANKQKDTTELKTLAKTSSIDFPSPRKIIDGSSTLTEKVIQEIVPNIRGSGEKLKNCCHLWVGNNYQSEKECVPLPQLVLA